MAIADGFGHFRGWPLQSFATAGDAGPSPCSRGCRQREQEWNPHIGLAPSHSSPFPKAAAPKGVIPGVLEVPPLRVGKWEIDVRQAQSSCHKSQPCAGGSGALQGCSYLYASFAQSRFIIDCGAALQRQPRLRWIVQDTKYK